MTRMYALMLAASLALPSVVAHAQPLPSKPADPAEVAYQEGKRLYDVQEWDAAIAKFKEAYKLRSDQPSLFNIAQAFRLKGDCQGAITAYRTYKRNFPTADNLPKVDKFLGELEASCPKVPPPPTPALTEVPPITTPIDPTVVPTEPIVPIPTEPTRPTGPTGPKSSTAAGRTKRIIGYGAVAVGGVGIAAGIVFAVSAQNHADTASAGSGVWDPHVQTVGQNAAQRARISFVVGGLALAGGVTLVVLGRHDARDHGSKISLVPGSAGGQLVWSGRF
ncbi:MAG: tetratricopeptide repeat protein [Proteobacteria bacterium]|nr:tetratricopeptide repeat protein [Pseudomonadota bacterium]